MPVATDERFYGPIAATERHGIRSYMIASGETHRCKDEACKS